MYFHRWDLDNIWHLVLLVNGDHNFEEAQMDIQVGNSVYTYFSFYLSTKLCKLQVDYINSSTSRGHMRHVCAAVRITNLQRPHLLWNRRYQCILSGRLCATHRSQIFLFWGCTVHSYIFTSRRSLIQLFSAEFSLSVVCPSIQCERCQFSLPESTTRYCHSEHSYWVTCRVTTIGIQFSMDDSRLLAPNPCGSSSSRDQLISSIYKRLTYHKNGWWRPLRRFQPPKSRFLGSSHWSGSATWQPTWSSVPEGL